MKDFKTQWEKTLATMAYLGGRLTDGEGIFKRVKDDNPNTLFLRARPTLEKSVNISMVERDGSKLTKAMDDELNENHEYLIQIVDAAATIATRMIKDFSLKHLQMFEKILFNMESRRNYQEAIYIAQVVLDQLSEKGNNDLRGTPHFIHFIFFQL